MWLGSDLAGFKDVFYPGRDGGWFNRAKRFGGGDKELICVVIDCQ